MEFERSNDPVENAMYTLVQSAAIVGALFPQGPVDVAKDYMKRSIVRKSTTIYSSIIHSMRR